MTSGRHSGFTLIELIVVVALLAIIASIAVPNFTTLVRNNQLQAKAEELHDLLQYARGEAVANRQAAQITIGTDDWLLNAGDSKRTFNHTIQNALAQTNLSGTTTLYRANGTASAARFTVCKGSDTGSGYLIEVRASGVTQLYPRGKQDASGTNLSSCSP